MTFVEICFLSVFYGGVTYLAAAGRMRALWNRCFGTRPWLVWWIVGGLILLAIVDVPGLPAQTH